MSINSALADKIYYSKYMVMHDWWILLSAVNANATIILYKISTCEIQATF